MSGCRSTPVTVCVCVCECECVCVCVCMCVRIYNIERSNKTAEFILSLMSPLFGGSTVVCSV